MKRDKPNRIYQFRRATIVIIFVIVSVMLSWRAVYLQVLNNEFLRNHGDARAIRVVKIPAHRGMITDRNGEPMAISTPVDSIWAVPKQLLENRNKIPVLADKLGMDPEALIQMLNERITREFVYLKRHVSPELAKQINELDIFGVNLQKEFKRYYPAAEVAAHLIGFTNVDDSGQEGLELAYDDWLRGIPGEKRVLKDRLGRVIRDVESITPTDPGNALELSVDRRVQYLAYRELAAAVSRYKARSGSLVILNPNTGEVLALAVQPSYNPNNRSGMRSDYFRNRAITDVFEPGSTLKPFTIAAALRTGIYNEASRIETSPGYLKVSNHIINDSSNHGTLSLSGILQKSSNVGAGKIGLAIGPEALWEIYRDVGLGESTGSGFPGESPGILSNYSNWSELDLASIAFGHGIAVTAMQLAQAYSVIAADGVLNPVTFLKTDPDDVAGKHVMSVQISQEISKMLKMAVAPGGTGERAKVPFYHVMGKTGTAHKSTSTGYAEDRYLSLFAGVAPANTPKLVMAVIIDEPQGDHYYGGDVAAPVFSRVAQGTLRILNIPPDDMTQSQVDTLMADKSPEKLEKLEKLR